MTSQKDSCRGGLKHVKFSFLPSAIPVRGRGTWVLKVTLCTDHKGLIFSSSKYLFHYISLGQSVRVWFLMIKGAIFPNLLLNLVEKIMKMFWLKLQGYSFLKKICKGIFFMLQCNLLRRTPLGQTKVSV